MADLRSGAAPVRRQRPARASASQDSSPSAYAAHFRFRPLELGLLVLVVLVGLGFLGSLALGGHRPLGPGVLQSGLAVAGLLLLLHVALTVFCPYADQTLLPITGLLTYCGLAVIGRVEPELVDRQVIWVGIASVAGVVALVWPGLLVIFQRYRYTLITMGLGLVIATFVFGIDPNDSGAKLWLGFGGVYFQPSEVLKLLLVAFLASYLSEKRELLTFGGYRFGRLVLPPLPYLAPLVVILGLSLMLLLIQRDLGAALLFFGISLAMLYTASGRSSYLLGGLGLFVGGVFAAYRLFSVAQRRIDIWLDPWSDPTGPSFQIVQGLVAFASGGVAGTGWGYGASGLLLAAHTDYPFAVIGEQLGMIGTLAVVMLYLLLVTRAIRVALAFGSSQTFEALLALGLGCVIGLQSLIILSGNLAILPLTGITLPFVSYGGSSLLTNFLILGLLLRLSHLAMDSR